MREEELARQLHLHPKQLRRILRMLEEEYLIVREHRKEVRWWCSGEAPSGNLFMCGVQMCMVCVHSLGSALEWLLVACVRRARHSCCRQRPIPQCGTACFTHCGPPTAFNMLMLHIVESTGSFHR